MPHARLPDMRFALVALICAACSGPIAGTRVERPRRPPPPGPPVATALASDPAGIRVLANTNAGSGRAGLLATNATEFAALWSAVGLGHSPPAIDFAMYVVLGTNVEDGVCQPELVAAHIDAAHVLTFEQASLAEMCILLASRSSTVVAVPRSLLPPQFTWRTDGGDFAFTLPPQSAIAWHPSLAIDTGVRASIASSRGTVALPAPGHIALRTLDDGRQVWVARRTTDDISVLLADRPSRTRGVRTVLGWNDKSHRFFSGHDSRGRSVQGGHSLEVLSFARLDDRISIGDPIDAPYAPPIARADEPTLDGPDMPYATIEPTTFSAVPDGHIAVIADSLVIGTTSQAQLCTLPEGKARQFLSGCLRSHPSVPVLSTRSSRRGISMTHGPLAILRRGNTADFIIDLGHGQSGWTVEHSFERPAERGPTRRRDALPLGVTVTGSTANGRNGYDAPDACVPIAGRGSPDESWSFTPPRTGTYVFELETTYDGTLAILDEAAPHNWDNTIACNDDAKGFYRRSAIRVELTAFAKLRVVVDGFGGARGAYRLRVVEQPTLPALTVGTPVRGDTTNAIDLESHGCTADGPDHRYPLTIREKGRYSFRIDTPGWAPMLSVFPARGSEFGCYTHVPPLVDSQLMEPGDYFVVIDGGDKKQRGPYTLTVERCTSEGEKDCEATSRSH